MGPHVVCTHCNGSKIRRKSVDNGEYGTSPCLGCGFFKFTQMKGLYATGMKYTFLLRGEKVLKITDVGCSRGDRLLHGLM